MDVIHYPDDRRPASWRHAVLALGNFDGVHRGHQRIVERVTRAARERGVVPLVLTFDPHPTRIVRPDKAPRLLMTLAQKLEVLAQAGVRGAAVVRFTPDIAAWDPCTFARVVLAEWLEVAEVWVGAGFLFGHDRSGDVSLLQRLGSRYGFRAETIEPVRYQGATVSSTRLRRLVVEGRVQEAAALMGRPYFMDGTVVHGLQRGRTLGFPTANLESENLLTPSNGVYATLATVDGVVYPSVTNVGVRPTFHQPSAVVIETHLLDVERDLYGRRLRVAFVRRIRDELTFGGAGELKAQITADCVHARALFARLSR